LLAESIAAWATDLVSDEGLLDRSQILKWGKKHMTVIRTTNILDEVSKLFGQSCQNFIFVLNGVWLAISMRMAGARASTYHPRRVSTHPAFSRDLAPMQW
jgi:hypothetical protein